MKMHVQVSVATVLMLVIGIIGGCFNDSGTGEVASTKPDASPSNAPATTAPPAESPAGVNATAQAVASDGVLSSDGTYYVVYELDAGEIPLNEMFGLTVGVYDGQDRTTMLEGIEFAIDARMPHHRHGMNLEPTVERREDGRFDVGGMLFHMPGYWEIYFDITRAGVTERAQTEVTLE
jgi:hypothetical protein